MTKTAPDAVATAMVSGTFFEPKIMPPYQIIYADPPWDYGGGGMYGDKGQDTGGVLDHYSTLTDHELVQLDIGRLADPNGTLLFLWTTGPMVFRSLAVMDGWGFKYATMAFVWYKQFTNPGYYTMSQTEFCLVGKIGKIPQPRGARNVRQFVSHKRGLHSAKPDEVRDAIDLMFPTQNKIELFARSMVPGWDAWGIDVGNMEPW